MEIDISDQNITFDGDFVVGFGSINATTYVGYDENLNNGRSWDFDNVSLWEQWTEAYLIRAVVEYPGGKISEIGFTQNSNSNIRITEKSTHPLDHSSLSVVKPIINQTKDSRGLEGYNVYRNDQKINSDIVEDLFYTDTELPIGSFEYYVTAVYSGGESDPSNIVTIIVTDMEENISSNIQVYPNPTQNLLNIKAENILSIRIISITGQLVLDMEAKGNKAVIDVNELKPGVYFVNIDTQSGSVSRKIIVK